ncbi:MAG: DNA recombination protein RmuC [Ignavibacteria bacterium]|nr:DNA recombination protein RmuC [Ignavibacteria bacterium]MCC7158419.1 DNA recombination protein RmuC [Ignavibacteria bacterium]
MEIIYLVVGILIGITIGYFVVKSKISALTSKLEEKEKLISEKDNSINASKDEIVAERNHVMDLSNELAGFKANYTNLEDKLRTQKSELEELQIRLKTDFENTANRIFNETTKQSKSNIEEILNPIKQKIKEFGEKIESSQLEDTKQRVSLIEKIRELHGQSIKISEDATNLTNAIRGDTKKQGDWGEVRLELLLEKAGLKKDVHYTVQESFKDDEGKVKRPDFVINLPDKKHLILDSKVSLNAYSNYFNSENDEDRVRFLKLHIESLTNHVKDLSSKDYQMLYDINSPDYVLMYIPIDSAFNLAVENDKELYLWALENKNVLLVSTTTLLATLSIISFIWKQDNQRRNALEIAKQSGTLYDQFVSLLKDLNDIGVFINKSRESYEAAMKRLTVGNRGNLITKVQNLKELGAKTNKTIDQKWLDRANHEHNEENKEDI